MGGFGLLKDSKEKQSLLKHCSSFWAVFLVPQCNRFSTQWMEMWSHSFEMATHHILGTRICFWARAVQALKDSYLLAVLLTCKMSVLILSCRISLGNTSGVLTKDNFHSVLVEDEQALDHFSPTHKARAEQQQQKCECITDWAHPDGIFWISAPSAGILTSVHGAAEVLPHSTHPASIQEVSYQQARPACSHTTSQNLHPGTPMNVQRPLFKPEQAGLLQVHKLIQNYAAARCLELPGPLNCQEKQSAIWRKKLGWQVYNLQQKESEPNPSF